jgi:hypothetical protein
LNILSFFWIIISYFREPWAQLSRPCASDVRQKWSGAERLLPPPAHLSCPLSHLPLSHLPLSHPPPLRRIANLSFCPPAPGTNPYHLFLFLQGSHYYHHHPPAPSISTHLLAWSQKCHEIWPIASCVLCARSALACATTQTRMPASCVSVYCYACVDNTPKILERVHRARIVR